MSNSHYEKFTLSGEVKCIDDEIPFDLPNGWEWCRGREIFLPMESTKPSEEVFTYIDVDAVNNRTNIIDNPKVIVSTNAPSRATRKLHRNDILFSMVRPYLRNIALVPEEFSQAIASTGFYVITPSVQVVPCYIYYLVLSSYVVDGLNTFMKGENSPSINNSHIDDFLYPLPPLAEQKRIVAKIEELMPLVEQYGKAQSEHEALNSNIREQLKKSVLQYAIEGKLVPQCEEDGTAEDLLAEIQAEKKRLYAEGKLKKKDLAYSTIFRGGDNKYYEQVGKEVTDITEDIPYELPNGWCFCRLSFLCWLDDAIKHSNEILPYLDAKYQRGNSHPNYTEEGRIVEPHTKVILVDGENSGEVFIIRERGYLGSTFKVLQSVSQVLEIWLRYILEAYRPLLKGSKVGAAIPHLNKKLFQSLIVGLPSQTEQKIIATELDTIFQLIEG